jgi:hypothetical protein
MAIQAFQAWLVVKPPPYYKTTHMGVTLLNYIDLPSHLFSNFGVHLGPFLGSVPKGVTNEK